MREKLEQGCERKRTLLEAFPIAAELIGATPEEVLSAAYELLVAGFVGLYLKANGQGSPVPELPAFEEGFAAVFMECCARHGVASRRIRWQKTEG